MKKQFLKIAGVTSEAAFYKKYPTEEAFFAAHPEARNIKAMGGTPEAFPQIATFDKAFSYGVPPGPQYLSHGGSAYPQAQTEQQFFIPIYTDVYNPYNKAMGGSNVEMYPNAKTTPHWGPSNVWFQDGGQEGMTQEQPELDRLGVQNRTGAFATILKQTASKANEKNAMMSATSKYGFEAGGSLKKYQSTGQVTSLTPEELDLAKKFNINDPGFDPAGTRLKIKQQQRESWIDEQMQTKPKQGGMIYDPAMAAAVRAALQEGTFPLYGPGFRAGQPLYAANYPGMIAEYPMGPSGYPQGNMGNFLDDYFAYTTSGRYPGSTTRGKVTVDGQRAGKFYGNMPLIKAMMPELYGKGNFADMMTNNADFRNRAEAMGLTNYKEPTGLKKLWGSREYTFNQRVPWEAPTVTLDPKQTPPASSSKEVPPLLKDDPAYRAQPQAPGYTNPMSKFMPPVPADPGIKIPYAANPVSSNNTSYMSPESYGVINQFENTVGTYDPITGKPISMEAGDQYAQTADKEKIESYINSTIGKDTWDKLPENVKTQAYSFMFNNGVTKPVRDANNNITGEETNYNALKGLAQAIDNATGGGDLGDERRAYTPEQAINKIKSADLSNPDLYNNYVNVLGDQYGSVASSTDKFKSGPGANYVPTLQRRAISIDEIMNSRGMNSKSPTTTTTRQAPSNTNSMDAATRQKKAGPTVNQAYIDEQRAAAAQNSAAPASAYSWSDMSTTPTRPNTEGIYTTDYLGTEPANNPPSVQISPSFTTDAYTQFMPQMTYNAGPLNTVGPREDFGYGGYTGYKFGGSYKQGDVVYMSDDEIAEFIKNGGQIEEME
jgi:hypothetical protein